MERLISEKSRIESILNSNVFTTKRLLIRPIEPQDKLLFRQLYTDKKIMRNIAEPMTIEQADRAFETSLNNTKKANPKQMSWVITSRSDEQAIGIQGLVWHGEDRTQAEIGIMLLRKANGKLLPEEAMGALMEYAYRELDIVRINAQFSGRNLATVRFVKKLGFVFKTPLISTECIEIPSKSFDKHCFAEKNHYKL